MNYENAFFRDATVCVLDTLEGEIYWVNHHSSGDREVKVPFYYSMVGGDTERFLLDSFSDDVVNDNRYVELNTDMIPRGHLTLTGFDIKSNEMANPNVWLKRVLENDTEIKKVLAKIRAVPISIKYDLSILVNSEIDSFKCSQALMNTLWLYRFMYFEYNYMNIDAVMILPDSNQVEISRDINMTSSNQIKLTVSFEVHTYYPAFRDTNNQNDIVDPKRTKWYANLHQANKGGSIQFSPQPDDYVITSTTTTTTTIP